MKTDINMANRQCCDLDIRDYKTKKPWMFADFCNTTTTGFSADSTYANKKGQKCVKFDNPGDGTISCTFQVHPFRMYALMSDGEILSDAILPARETVKAAEAGKLTVTGTPVAGTVFCYAADDFGGVAIEGTFANSVFTATTESSIVADGEYIVGYLESRKSGVQRVQFNNKKNPKAYYITMETLDKDENDDLVPIRIIAYKACPQKSLDLSFSSDGDPAEVTITFDCLVDNDDNVLDLVEIRNED